MVLRQVKDKMNVGQLDRLEAEKLTFKHKEPNKNFGKWLMQKIELQIMWKEITKQQKRRKEMTRDEFMSKLIFEEKTWEIASNMDMINRF